MVRLGAWGRAKWARFLLVLVVSHALEACGPGGEAPSGDAPPANEHDTLRTQLRKRSPRHRDDPHRNARVIPRLDCIAREADGSTVALLGYENTGPVSRSIEHGSLNQFTRGVADRGQPTSFLPGRREKVFAVRLEEATAIWELDGARAVATRKGPPCDLRVEARPVQDTGLRAARPNENFGSNPAALVTDQDIFLIQFDRSELKSRLGTGLVVAEATLVVKTEPGYPASAAARSPLEALVMLQTWEEHMATWRCASDSDTSNDSLDCARNDAWDIAEGSPFHDRAEGPAVAGRWHGSRVEFDVTQDVQAFLGLEHGRRPLSWALRGTPDVEAAHLSTRESRRRPELRLRLAPMADAPGLLVEVDPSVPAYAGEPLEPEGTSGPRPIAGMVDPKGNVAYFVEDELMIHTSDVTELARFVTDWNGEVLGSSETVAGVLDFHLVRIDPALADSPALPAMLLDIDARPRGLHRVSSVRALGLLAAASEEFLNGAIVSVNWVGDEGDVIDFDRIRDHELNDGEDDSNQGFGSNAFDWPHITDDAETRSPPFGVEDAWLRLFFSPVLDASGEIVRNSRLIPGLNRVAIVDRGFNVPFLQKELPSFDLRGSCDDSVNGCLAGNWHGTRVAQAGFGEPGNGFAAAGPGGPVSSLELSHRSADLAGHMAGVRGALNRRANLINLSRRIQTPAIATFTLEGYNDLTWEAWATGHLVIASAGNQGKSVDAEDCFIACWEETWHSPCENDGVICVGGVQQFDDRRHPDSNWGGENVDIWGPFEVYTGGPTLASQTPQDAFATSSGTSVATPFVTGVAALTVAAVHDDEPTLDIHGFNIWRILKDTASRSSDSRVNRIVNASAAVRRGLVNWRDLPPRVRIVAPASGAQVEVGVPHRFSAEAISIDGAPVRTFAWASDHEGPLGTGQNLDAALHTTGSHRVEVLACSDTGRCNSDSVLVQAVVSPPLLEITAPPVDGLTFPGDVPITFSATIRNRFLFPCEAISWSGDVLASKRGCTVLLDPLRVGENRIRASYTELGQEALAERLIFVEEPTGDLRVRILSPEPGFNGEATLDPDEEALLAASVANLNGASLTAAWFFESTGVGPIGVASGLETSWTPALDLLPKCGGYAGALSIIVSTDDGRVAGHSIPVFVEYPVC